MGNKKSSFVAAQGCLNKCSSETGNGLSLDLTDPETIVSAKEIVNLIDVSDLSMEEIIAIAKDSRFIDTELTPETPENPPSFVAFDPYQNPAILLQEKFSNHLSDCSYSEKMFAEQPPKKTDLTDKKEKNSSIDFDKFLELSRGGDDKVLTNRDRLIPKNFSHRQFQKSRR